MTLGDLVVLGGENRRRKERIERREERIGRRENRGSLGELGVLAELGALGINASAMGTPEEKIGINASTYTRAYIKEEG